MKIAVILIAIFISGCVHRREVHSGSPQLKIANSASIFPDYRGPTTEAANSAINAAIAGDDVELDRVLSFARFTDGEGALSFGMLLNSLNDVVGESRFDNSLKKLPQDQQASVISIMRSANQMNRFIREN